MLANTPAGDAYTYREIKDMAAAADLNVNTRHDLSNGVQTVIVASK